MKETCSEQSNKSWLKRLKKINRTRRKQRLKIDDITDEAAICPVAQWRAKNDQEQLKDETTKNNQKSKNDNVGKTKRWRGVNRTQGKKRETQSKCSRLGEAFTKESIGNLDNSGKRKRLHGKK